MLFKRTLLALGAMVMLTVPAHALKYGITSKVLDNGLEVIVVENHGVPLVTIEITAKNGAYTEPPALDGLSHLYEHMFFKANRAIPNQERYLERTRELGMSWNGTTSDERVNYFFTLHKNDLDDGLQFMNDAIRYPLFLEDELLREREVVNAEFDRNEANPFFHLGRAIGKAMWWKYYSRKNVIGDRDTILSADQDKLRLIQSRYYIPNNSALIISGDVTPDVVFTKVEAMFGDWERGEDPFIKNPIPKHPPIPESKTVVVTQPVNFVFVQRGWHGPSMRDDVAATFAADVFSYILGQPDSKFQKNLVDAGLVDGVGIGYFSLVHTGPITLGARTSADRYEKAITAIDAEIEKFDNPDYFTDEQLEYAKNQLEISEIYNREQANQFSHTLSFWWCTGGLDYYMNYIDNLRKVSRDDIYKYVNTYIKGKPAITGIMLSESDQQSLQLRGDNR
jgi:zinc protease